MSEEKKELEVFDFAGRAQQIETTLPEVEAVKSIITDIHNMVFEPMIGDLEVIVQNQAMMNSEFAKFALALSGLIKVLVDKNIIKKEDYDEAVNVVAATMKENLKKKTEEMQQELSSNDNSTTPSLHSLPPE